MWRLVIGNIYREDMYYRRFLGGTLVSKGEREQNKKGKGGNKGAVIVTVVAVVVIIALIGVIVFLLQPQEEEEKRRNVVITPENIEEILEEIENEQSMVSSGYYTVTMNPTWHFQNGGEISTDAVVENVEKNTNDVYFDILMGENETVIYESPVIPRGSRLENISLSETFESGTYDCVVEYHLIDEEQNTLSTLRVALQIIIEE